MKDFVLKNVRWISQGCLRIACDDIIIYTDPFDVDKPYNDADYILISHAHSDHYSPEDIKKVVKEDTVFIFPKSMQIEANNYVNHVIYFVMPYDVIKLDKVCFEAVCAYNIDKIQCHPKENDWVGYIIKIYDYSLYYASDTELIPEMKEIVCDVIFVPLGQTYTMNSVEDAVKAVEYTKSKVAVPIHYGKFEGTKEDAEKFVSMLKNKAEAIIL